MTNKTRVLVVDDDARFTRTLSDILATEGFAPMAAAEGEAALAAVRKEAPAAAVIDLVLRDISGLEVLKGIKDLSPATECIVLTGHASQQSAIEAVNLGAYSYLLKPVELEQLLLTIRRAVEKAEAERALRESEEKFRLVVEGASEGIILLDLKGDVLEVNARVVEMSGLERDEIVGRNVAELLPHIGLEVPSLLGRIKARFLGKGPTSMELTITSAEGRKTTVLARTSLVKKDGKIAGLSAILEDITERKQAEEELRRLKDFNESIVQSMAEGITVLDAEGRLTFVNPAIAAMWGYAEDELIGKHWKDIVPPHQHHIVGAADARRFKGESDRYELEQSREDGTRFSTLVSGIPLFEDGEFAGTLAVFTDITELKKAQEEIGKLSQFQESIIESANVWLDVLDENANVVLWNKAAEEISGFSREEVIGHGKIWEWLYPDEEYRKEIVASAKATIHGQADEGLETIIRRKDGEIRTISWHSRNIVDAEWRPIGSVALGRDVTEHKEAQEALRESEEKYRNVVERANDGIVIVQHSLLKYLNPALTAMTGYATAEVIDTPFTAHIWSDDLPIVEERYRRRLAGEDVPATYEAGIVHSDGHRIPVELNAGVVTYEGEPADLVIVRDITERKRAEEEIQRRTDEQERRLAEMTTLYETSLEIVGQLDLPQLLHSVLRRAVRLVRAQAGQIWLYRPDEDSLELIADQGVRESLVGSRLAIGEGLTGKVLQTGLASAIDDYAEREERTSDHHASSVRAIISTPLKWGDETIGVINVFETQRTREWEDHDLRLLALLASQAAAAIKNASLYEETVRKAEELAALYDVSLEMASQLELSSLLDTVVERAIDLLGGFAGGLYTYDPDSRDLELIAAKWPGKDPGGIRLATGDGVCGKVAQTGKPLVVIDYANWEGRPGQFDAGPSFNVLAVPVKRGDRLLGALYVNDQNVEGRFDEADIRLATMFANQAAIALENARLYEERRRRADELATLYDISLEVVAETDLSALLPSILQEAADLLRSDCGGVYLLDPELQELELRVSYGYHRDYTSLKLSLGEGLAGKVAQSKEPLAIDNYSDWKGRSPQWEDENLSAVLAVPLLRGATCLGVLGMDRRSPVAFDENEVRLATLFANQAAVAIENARLLSAVKEHQSDLQRLSGQLIRAQEAERKRISQELHDELGQALTAMSINLAAMERALPPEPDPLILERLDETKALVDETLDQMRDLSLELRPSMLDDLGLVPTLRWYANSYQKRAGIQVQLETINLEERLEPETETVLYRVAQEALTNAARHAQASTVVIRLERTRTSVTALIGDDGVGLDDTQPSAAEGAQRGAGLLGIRERVASRNGTFRIESQPGKGTTLIVEMPLTQDVDSASS